MIGKQTKGTSFGRCVSYVLKEEKARLLEAVGVDGLPEQMAERFELQSLLNDKVKNIVGAHLAQLLSAGQLAFTKRRCVDAENRS